MNTFMGNDVCGSADALYAALRSSLTDLGRIIGPNHIHQPTLELYAKCKLQSKAAF